MSEDARSSDWKRCLGSDAVLVGLGLSTAVLTAIAVAVVALSLGMAIHLYFLWGVIPAGAFLCGMVSAAGYPLGAVVIGRRPAKLAYFGVLIGGPLTYLLIFAFEYLLMNVDGRPISTEIPFATFVDASIRNTTLSHRWHASSSPPLGAVGYPFAGLSLIGVIVGSLSIFGTPPFGRTACDRCARYMRDIAAVSEYVGAPQLAARFSYARDLLAAGETDSALKLIGSSTETDGSHQLALDVKSCDACARDYHHLRVLRWDTMARPPWVTVKGAEVERQVFRRSSSPERSSPL
jgi:hypothetical protein